MVTIDIDKGRILTVKVKGRLVKEDYERFSKLVEQRIRTFGRIRVLLEMNDFHGWTAGALWEDIRFDIRHFSDIERLAMVGERAWEKGMAVFCKPFTTARVKYFDRSELAAAREWIEADLRVLNRSG